MVHQQIVQEGGEPQTFWQIILNLNFEHNPKGAPWIFEKHITWAKSQTTDHSPQNLYTIASTALDQRAKASISAHSGQGKVLVT